MLLKNYQILIFKEREGKCHTMNFRGWLWAFFLLLFLGLLASTLYYYQFEAKNTVLEHQLMEAKQIIERQNNQIISTAGKLKDLEADFARVQVFNTKLRVIMNITTDTPDSPLAASLGGNTNLSQYLPLHKQNILARQIHSLLEDLTADIRLEEVQQQDLIQSTYKNQTILAATPSIWPVQGHLTSRFGTRSSPFTGRTTIHKGLDIANRSGTPVHAPASGTVTFSGVEGGYGNCVVINHGNGVTTRYAHLQKSLVTSGQRVQRGDTIALLGNSGRSTGPHLHYEVLVGNIPVDPMRYILN